MRANGNFIVFFALATALLTAGSQAEADEFGFSSYGLGGAAFGAGATLTGRAATYPEAKLDMQLAIIFIRSLASRPLPEIFWQVFLLVCITTRAPPRETRTNGALYQTRRI